MMGRAKHIGIATRMTVATIAVATPRSSFGVGERVRNRCTAATACTPPNPPRPLHLFSEFVLDSQRLVGRRLIRGRGWRFLTVDPVIWRSAECAYSLLAIIALAQAVCPSKPSDFAMSR
jgi:hypothetical protein